MYNLLKDIFSIKSSITGEGNRIKLKLIKKFIPIKIIEYKSGQKCFDWTIPKEWKLKEAFIKDIISNKKILDFKNNYLNVINYSQSIDTIITGNQLKKNIHTISNLPNAIPYITSYYKKRWGFCLKYNDVKKIKKHKYHVKISSSFKNGSLSIGEAFIKGSSKKEIIFSSYICHPLQANDGNSGVALSVALYKFIKKLSNLHYSYRFIYIPETIGSIAYISNNLKKLKKNTFAGLVVTCVGDKGIFNYKKTKKGIHDIDLIVENILKHSRYKYKIHEFSPLGSDERQFSSPGVNLMFGSLMRTMYGHYKQYHTSEDNFSIVKEKYLNESFKIYKEIVNSIEINHKYIRQMPYGELMLQKHGLYNTLGNTNSFTSNEITDHDKNIIMWVLNYSDGNVSLIEIANKMNIGILKLKNILHILIKKKLINKI